MPDNHFPSFSEKIPYAQPKEIHLTQIPGGVEITRRWSFKFTELTFGGFVFLLIGFLSATSGTIQVPQGWSIVCMILGLFLIYPAFAGLVNWTRISVVFNEIAVRRGPLPWMGSRVLSSGNVIGLSLLGEKHRSKNSSWETYKVVASLQDGRVIVLDECDRRDPAGFLCQELGRYLSVASQPASLKKERSSLRYLDTYSEEDMVFEHWLYAQGFKRFPLLQDETRLSVHIENRGECEGMEYIEFPPYRLFQLRSKELPDFYLEEKGVFNRAGSIQFEKNPFFDAEYSVKSQDEATTRRVFSEPVRDFIRNNKFQMIESKGSLVLMGYVSYAEESNALGLMVELLKKMRQAIV